MKSRGEQQTAWRGRRPSRPRRRLAITLGCVALLALGAYQQRRLPDPADCSPNQLVRWLIRPDLATQPTAVHVQLANRFETLLNRSPESFDLSGADEKYARQIAENTRVLTSAWLLYQVDLAHQLDTAQRQAHIQRLTQTVQRLMAVFSGQPTTPSRDAPKSPVLAAAHDAWAEASPFQQQQLQKLAVDAGLYWLDSHEIQSVPRPIRRILFDITSSLTAHTVVASSSTAKMSAFASAATQDSPMPHSWSSKNPQRVTQNVQRLAESWIVEAAERYALLTDPSHREAFLDQQIDCLRVLRRLTAFLTPASPATGITSAVQSPVQTVLEKVTTDQRCRSFVTDLQKRWLAQTFGWIKRLGAAQ